MITATPLTLGLAIPPWPPIEHIYRAVDLAESLGLEVCSTWDHFVEFSAPTDGASANAPAPFEYQTLLGALATRAVSVRLAVGVTELLRRHPVVVAQSFITLAHVSRRPPILGIGAGERANTERFGLPFDSPVDRLEEGLHLIRDCLDGRSPLVFEGRSFELHDATFGLRPPRDRLPEVWIGGRGPRMRRLAGRFGDGWYPTDIVNPHDYAEGVASVRSAAEAHGRDPDAVVPAAELVVLLAPDGSGVRAALESDDGRLFGLLLGADAWRAAGLHHPFGERHRGFVDQDPSQVTHDVLTSVPPELVARHVLAGSPEQIGEQLAALREAGLRHVNLSFGPLEDDASTLVVRDVIEAVRRRTGG